jgi:anti-sigma B factor antagonist
VRFNHKPSAGLEVTCPRAGTSDLDREVPVTASLEPTSDLVTIDVDDDSPSVRVTAHGEIDSSSAPQLRSRLDGVLDRGGVQQLTIDLDGVTFLDSAGLCVLAATHRRASSEGVAMRVLASSRAVIRPLQITGLWDLLAAVRVEPGTGSAA